MGRQLLWLLLSQKLLLSLATDTMADTAMVATEVMAMAVMVTTAFTARGLRMPTTDTEDTEDMVMATVMATVMDTDTTVKKEGACDDVKIEFSGYNVKWICEKSSHGILLFAKEIY